MSRRWGTTALALLAVHVLFGAGTVLAHRSDQGEDPIGDSGIQPVPRDGALEAGTYTSSAVGHETVFSVGDGWSVVYPPVGDRGFAIGPTSGGHLLGFIPFDGRVTAEQCFSPERSMDLYEAQVAMSAWLADPANQMTVDASAEGF